MSHNVLVIGGGGREHAICWKLAQSLQVKKIFAAPGNVGIGQLDKAVNISLDVKNFKDVAAWCEKEKVSLVVVGPEDPLANGISDALQSAGIKCFGPSRLAARIEADKDWAKQFMDRHNIPTARWKGFTVADEAVKFINSAPYEALVVKASGLAAGKGVVVASDRLEASAAVREILVERKFGAAGDSVVVEELLDGPEVSVLGFSDGVSVRAMLPAQDHKRALDGDRGPNTGGMGAYCPCPLLPPTQLAWVERQVLQQTVDGLRQEGCPFVGVLYAGLMLTKEGPKVLEFNCRFGDPETEVLMPLLDTDLFEIMMACCEGRMSKQDVRWVHEKSAVTVIIASRGYPESSSKGDVIKGVDTVSQCPDTVVFHCGTARTSEGLVTAGGRVIAVTSQCSQLPAAAARATQACRQISFPGAQFRTDIAHKGIARWILQKGLMTYKESGVDITAGNSLVTSIKPAVEATALTGVMGSLGGFGALFDLKACSYKDPILVSGTDGVGTKLKIAQELGHYSTLGQDLVAMCVNDVLCQGAKPLFFLDYFACGRLEVGVAAEIVKSIADACQKTGCALVGGETAEMAGLYAPGDFDLAGFCVGAVERSLMLPRLSLITSGDVVLALPSSGVHSNGFSLVRKVMSMQGLSCKDKSPFSDRILGEELLTPTALYVKPVMSVIDRVKASAHITGGGLLENIPRVLRNDLKVKLDTTQWTIPPVFGWLAAAGQISEYEMLRTFNCGVGMVLVVAKDQQAYVCSQLPEAKVIGLVCPRIGDESEVDVENFAAAIEPLMQPHINPLVKQIAARKRVGVLISGSGTNLQSLIDAMSGTGSVAMGAEIVVVISNKSGVEGLKRAERAGIPTEVIKHTEYSSRVEFDMAVHSSLVRAGVEIICLAGFMRVLTGTFVRLWRGRLLNIHPALLPLFKGTHAHRQALEAGVRLTGCTVHFVEEKPFDSWKERKWLRTFNLKDGRLSVLVEEQRERPSVVMNNFLAMNIYQPSLKEDIDAGAIIAQKAVDIETGDTEDILTERVKLAEHEIYPKALRLLATGLIQLDLSTNKIVWK